MINIFKQLTFLSMLLFVFSCSFNKSYSLNFQADLRIMEREDHKICLKQGGDIESWGSIDTEIYWRCRNQLVNERVIHDAVTSDEIRHNSIVNTIKKEITENLIKTKQVRISNLKGDINTLDHEKCVSLGFNIDRDNDKDIESYYKCRADLVDERIIISS